jgi:hypothetical protein
MSMQPATPRIKMEERSLPLLYGTKVAMNNISLTSPER